jgi:hypothetical protein
MSFSLQIAGKFLDSNKDIYFFKKFSLYFYEVNPTVSNNLSDNIIEKEFKYINNHEFLNKCLVDGNKFKIYDDFSNNPELVYDLKTNNIMLPSEIIDNLIETFTLDINNIIEESNTLLLPIGKQLNKIKNFDLDNVVSNDIYT